MSVYAQESSYTMIPLLLYVRLWLLHLRMDQGVQGLEACRMLFPTKGWDFVPRASGDALPVEAVRGACKRPLLGLLCIRAANWVQQLAAAGCCEYEWNLNSKYLR